MVASADPLLLSLKPCYADMVFDGIKTVELRRRMALYIENRRVFIYVSSPRRELRGGFRVGKVWKGTPDYVWQLVSSAASVGRQEYDAYFCGSEVAFALEITNVWQYNEPVQLGCLRRQLGEFVVPQSWRYLKSEEYNVLRELAPVRGHEVASSASAGARHSLPETEPDGRQPAVRL